MTIDVTERVQRYRRVLRHIWNEGVYVDPELRGWESHSLFQRVALPRFNLMIASPLGVTASPLSDRDFSVVPDEISIFPTLMVNECPPAVVGGGAWRVINGPFAPEGHHPVPY